MSFVTIIKEKSCTIFKHQFTRNIPEMPFSAGVNTYHFTTSICAMRKCWFLHLNKKYNVSFSWIWSRDQERSILSLLLLLNEVVISMLSQTQNNLFLLTGMSAPGATISSNKTATHLSPPLLKATLVRGRICARSVCKNKKTCKKLQRTRKSFVRDANLVRRELFVFRLTQLLFQLQDQVSQLLNSFISDEGLFSRDDVDVFVDIRPKGENNVL